MPAQTVELFLAVTYTRPTDPFVYRPLPGGYSLERLTIKRAADVAAGELVVGEVDQTVSHPHRLMRYATYRCAAYVAFPGPVDAECAPCRGLRCGAEAAGYVCLTPHNARPAGELVAVIPPYRPVVVPAPPCVHTCPRGGMYPNRYHAPSSCGECHRRPCPACLAAGRSVH